MKTCYKCRQQKLLEDFAIDNSRNSKDGHQNACKLCKAEMQRIYRKNSSPEQKEKRLAYNRDLRRRQKLENPLKIKNRERNYQLHRYGIDLDMYNRLFQEQKGLCLGCLKHASTLNTTLCVDHDHKTGKIRGLLCTNCNRAIGWAKDNSAILCRLAKYLEQRNNTNDLAAL